MTTQLVFRAVGDPTRRRVLELLQDGPAGFQDLHRHFPMTKGGLSQHLAVLRQAELVAVDDTDRARRYRLTPGPLKEVADWVLTYARFWDERLDALDALLARPDLIPPHDPETEDR
ncbi:metalloregulator ArsR/SmtB family transcription factor [Aquipuribacter nitratireducens]|uniref:ArsR/SmtB family transcription factor n=1 Tax=Aquipuribacter nitratireducens TaxID=650104 RepID=A0ABW0GNN1_9MICO